MAESSPRVFFPDDYKIIVMPQLKHLKRREPEDDCSFQLTQEVKRKPVFTR